MYEAYDVSQTCREGVFTGGGAATASPETCTGAGGVCTGVTTIGVGLTFCLRASTCTAGIVLRPYESVLGVMHDGIDSKVQHQGPKSIPVSLYIRGISAEDNLFRVRKQAMTANVFHSQTLSEPERGVQT